MKLNINMLCFKRSSCLKHTQTKKKNNCFLVDCVLTGPKTLSFDSVGKVSVDTGGQIIFLSPYRKTFVYSCSVKMSFSVCFYWNSRSQLINGGTKHRSTTTPSNFKGLQLRLGFHWLRHCSQSSGRKHN